MPLHARGRSQTHVGNGLLCAMVVVALAIPNLATASGRPPKKSASVPNCKHFSIAKMARMINVSSLTYDGDRSNPEGNECVYTHSEPDHYMTFLAVSVEATPRSVFDRAQEAFKQSADKTGKVFTTSTIHGAPEFSVDYVVDSASLPPCDSAQSLPETGPPLCNGEPTWESFVFYAYGAFKPNGPKVLVSAGISGEIPLRGIGARDLIAAILAGQVR